MMKIKNYILPLWIALALSGCQREDTPVATVLPNQDPIKVVLYINDNEPEQDAPVRGLPGDFCIAADDSLTGAVSTCVATHHWEADGGSKKINRADSTGTRSVAPGVSDTMIKDLWALQFDESGNLVGKPFYIDGLGISTTGQTVTLMLTQSGGKQHTVYFVANTGDNTLFTIDNAPTLNRFRALPHVFSGEAGATPNQVVMMTGAYTGTLTAGETIVNSIKMTRLISKLMFSFETGNFIDGTFQVFSVQLKNIPTYGLYLPPVGGVAPYPLGGAVSHADYKAEAPASPTSGDFTWYLPENVRGTNASIGWEGDKDREHAPAGQQDYATFVEVTGMAQMNDGSAKNVIYSFYIGRDMTEYSIERNTSYTFAVDFRGVDELDKRVRIGVSSPLLSPVVSLTDITGSGVTATANVMSDGGSALTENGFVISTRKDFQFDDADVQILPYASAYSLPAAASVFTRAGVAVGSYTLAITGLVGQTTYYLRPYATNAFGTTVGELVEFATSGAPAINTTKVDGISNTQATLHFLVTSSGASSVARVGAVYSTTDNFDPTDPAQRTEVAASGTSSQSVALTGLTPATIYYVRTFASNAEETGYSEQVSFTTFNVRFFTEKVHYLRKDQTCYVKTGAFNNNINYVDKAGIVWKETDFDPYDNSIPRTKIAGPYSEPTRAFTVKVTGVPDTNEWVMYPYAQLLSGEVFYGEKIAPRQFPTVIKPVIVVTTARNVGINISSAGSGDNIVNRGVAACRSGVGLNPTVVDPNYLLIAPPSDDYPITGTDGFLCSVKYPAPLFFCVGSCDLYGWAENSKGFVSYSEKLTENFMESIQFEPYYCFSRANIAYDEATNTCFLPVDARAKGSTFAATPVGESGPCQLLGTEKDWWMIPTGELKRLFVVPNGWKPATGGAGLILQISNSAFFVPTTGPYHSPDPTANVIYRGLDSTTEAPETKSTVFVIDYPNNGMRAAPDDRKYPVRCVRSNLK